MKVKYRGISVALAVFGILSIVGSSNVLASLILNGVIDGDLPGGLPKSVVIGVTADIADLSIYGAGSATNGGGTDGEEVSFSGSAASGDVIIVVDQTASQDFFTNNFSDSFIFFTSGGANGAANINGDDAVELFMNGGVIDTYGVINVDGTGETWEYTDGYAVRTGGSAGAFVEADWSINLQALDNLTELQQAQTIGGAFGFSLIPEPGAILLTLWGLCGSLMVSLRYRWG